MYLNILSPDVAKAHDRDLLAGVEQDRQAAMARRSHAGVPTLRAAARRVLHARSAAAK